MNLFEFASRQGDRLLSMALENLLLILLVIAIATALGVGVAVLTYRTTRPANAALAVTSVMLTIPSFALFGLMIPLLGLGWPPTVAALVSYALLPIVRNTIVGLRQVDPAVVDAARGMGMSRNRILWRIELPLAWPVIITGIRVSTMIVVGVSAIAAIVGGPGLGNFIFSGLSRIGGANAVNLALSGTLLLLVLGLLLDGAFLLLGNTTTPRGIRGE